MSSSNHGRSGARGKSKVRSKSKASNCYNCDQPGYFKRDCLNLKRSKGESNGQKNDDNTTSMVQNNDNVVLLINEEILPSYHLTMGGRHNNILPCHTDGDFGNMKMGNTSYSKIAGIRDVCIKTNVECTLALKDVRHVPDLRMNLISGVALDRDGYENYFANKK
ncbi:hypothetical protein KY285_010310 [Solanum tuberosum]|nr:hypothetical protein KY289_010854 [Solanum tuberosum]KAH0734603.1 hypothetical protein KY285_010310 [Solanum tuberosum]